MSECATVKGNWIRINTQHESGSAQHYSHNAWEARKGPKGWLACSSEACNNFPPHCGDFNALLVTQMQANFTACAARAFRARSLPGIGGFSRPWEQILWTASDMVALMGSPQCMNGEHIRGFLKWCPHRRGRGSKKSTKFADNQLRFCRQIG